MISQYDTGIIYITLPCLEVKVEIQKNLRYNTAPRIDIPIVYFKSTNKLYLPNLLSFYDY